MTAASDHAVLVRGFALGDAPGIEILALYYLADQAGLDGILTGVSVPVDDSQTVSSTLYGHFAKPDVAARVIALRYPPGQPAPGDFWTLTLDRGPKE